MFVLEVHNFHKVVDLLFYIFSLVIIIYCAFFIGVSVSSDYNKIQFIMKGKGLKLLNYNLNGCILDLYPTFNNFS